MLRIIFAKEDLARTRLATFDPLWELTLSIHMLRGQRGDLLFVGWRRATRAAVRQGDLNGRFRVLSAIVPTFGYFPDFLNPVAAQRSLDEGLDVIRSTPRAVLDRELRRLPAPVGDSAEFEALAGGDADALGRLTTSMRAYYDVAIAPHQRVLESEVARDRAIRLGILAEQGLVGLLASLRPMLDWVDGELRVPDHPDQEIELGGRGLLLVPSVFCVNHPITMFDPSLQPLLVYPIRQGGGALLPDTGPRRGLAALLGPTRARVLHALATGRTTTDLAKRVGISPASASEHAAVLRETGLVASHRDGNRMVHRLTGLGLSLLTGD